MNLDLLKQRTEKAMEIYSCSNRSMPNCFRMRSILDFNPRRYRFGEYVSVYKECSGGYS